MSEKPILFNGEMVRAILAGMKTQTRRMIKPQLSPVFLARGLVGAVPQWPHQNGVRLFMSDGLSELMPSPYPPGTKLWVRETWHAHLCAAREREALHYAADGPSCEADGETIKHWRPSIHMPRWASRITLEVTGVRVERVQDISEEDAYAEGVDTTPDSLGRYCPIIAFQTLWQSINENWSENPFVWVIEFRKL